MRPLLAFGILFSLVIHIIDQATDVFAAFLFYFEEDYVASGLTLSFVFAPGLFVFMSELKRMCCGKSNIFKASAYLLLSPLWAIIVHLYSLFDPCYIRTAFYFKTLEGFVEAGPQLILQLGLLFRGSWTDSSIRALEPYVGEGVLGVAAVKTRSMEVFGRYYQEDSLEVFGWIHILSVVMSFISILCSAVAFNELESPHSGGSSGGALSDAMEDDDDGHDVARGCNANLAARLSVGIPFFLFTLVYRSVGLSLAICFTKYWAGVLLFGLFFMNVLSSLAIGDTFPRAVAYALWSILVPVGFNRDPLSHLGHNKVPLHEYSPAAEQLRQDRDDSLTTRDTPPDEEPTILFLTKEQVLDLNNGSRAKHFLTCHVLSSLVIMAPFVFWMIVFVQVFPTFQGIGDRVFFDLNLLNLLFLPILGFSLAMSMFLARPYHRCDCTGGEKPKGNFIV